MFIKKVFLFFVPFFARLASKFEKSTFMTLKKNLKKIEKVIKKRRISGWFQIRWKIFYKMHQKKFLAKRDENMHFFTFTHVSQTCFAYNFLWIFIKTFSTDLKSAWNSASFGPFSIFQPNFFRSF
jgi:hypothetical protein